MVQAIEAFLPDLMEQFPSVDICYLFGSAAEDAMKTTSDIDIGVWLSDDSPLEDPLLDLRLSLWIEDRLQRCVDIVIMNRASAIMQHEVLRTGIRMVERSPRRRAERELASFKRYLDARYFQMRRMREACRHG